MSAGRTTPRKYRKLLFPRADLSSVSAIVTHGDERIEGVPSQPALAMQVREAGDTEVIAALLAMLYGHLGICRRKKVWSREIQRGCLLVGPPRAQQNVRLKDSLTPRLRRKVCLRPVAVAS